MRAADRVIELLDDRREGWWAMGELASAAELTLARLDKALVELADRGHRLDFSAGMGIRLRRGGPLDAHLIERDLGTKRVGRHAICFSVVDSTNDVAADSARQANSDGLAVLAEAQRKGRGRHGRRWLSPPGANILLSVLLKEPLPAASVSGGGRRAAGDTGTSEWPHQSAIRNPQSAMVEALTVAAGLAVAQAIHDACGLSCELKWPNDVLLERRKVAGILVEHRRHNQRRDVIVGIGVNVNAHPPEGEVDLPATSLAVHLPGFGVADSAAMERTPIVRAILRRLDGWVTHLADEPREALDRLREEWLRRCAFLNERISVAVGSRKYTGRAVGIDPLEGLVLLADDGTQVHIPAGRARVL